MLTRSDRRTLENLAVQCPDAAEAIAAALADLDASTAERDRLRALLVRVASPQSMWTRMQLDDDIAAALADIFGASAAAVLAAAAPQTEAT